MPDPLEYGDAFKLGCPADSELWEHLIHRGWCPFQIQSMQQTIGLEALLIASMIQKDSMVSASHARCLHRTCVANQVQAGQYAPKHARR